MKTLDYYMKLPWRTVVASPPSEDDSRIVFSHPELSSCLGQGNTVKEALEDLRTARRDLLTVMIECGDRIPEPTFEVNTVAILVHPKTSGEQQQWGFRIGE